MMTKEQREALINALNEIKTVCDNHFWSDEPCWDLCPLGNTEQCLLTKYHPCNWQISDKVAVWRALK